MNTSIPRVGALLLLLGACAVEHGSEPVASREDPIVGGVAVGTCGFPTTVLVGGGMGLEHLDEITNRLDLEMLHAVDHQAPGGSAFGLFEQIRDD